MANTSILLINYYWPPSGGPNVQRWVNIIREFSQSGITCFVVTPSEKKATYEVIDTSINQSVPKDVKVYKTDTSEVFNLYKKYIGKGKTPGFRLINEPNPNQKQKIARFIRGNIFLPDPRRGWNKYALKKSEYIINKHNINIIITAGNPHSTHLIGLALKHKYNLPWIADLHDYWTDLPLLQKFYRTKVAQHIDRYYEAKVLNTADIVMCHCQSAKHIYAAKVKNNDASKIHIHTMGYDEDLFNDKRDIKVKSQQKFIITYVGIMPIHCSPDSFFSALSKISKLYPKLPLVMRFVGLIPDTIHKILSKYKITTITEQTGYIHHKKIIPYLYDTTLFLLINMNNISEEIIVPGKIYEYLATKKPILSISPTNSENAAIINRCQAGKNFTRNQEKEMIEYISSLIEQWKIKRTLDLSDKNTKYKDYSRQYEAKKLVSLIDNTFGLSN